MSMLQSQAQELNCPICYQSCNAQTRQSTSICSNFHSICAHCVGNLQSLICPFCRANINFNSNQLEQDTSNQATPNQQQDINGRPNDPRITYLEILNSFITQIQDAFTLIFIIQFPLLFFDLIFILSKNDPICMDNKHDFFFTPRQYFITMEIWGLILASLFWIFPTLSKMVRRLQLTLTLLLIGKIVFWMIGESILFFKIVKDHCLGEVYVYCLIQAIIISLFIVILPVWYVQR